MKLASMLVFLIALALARPLPALFPGLFSCLLLLGLLLSKLPVGGVLLRAASVLPFTLTFAAISYLHGDTVRAVGLVTKSYLSAVAVILTVGTTPMPALFHAASHLGVPRVLVLVLQFIYRYLFVISEQALHMRDAALCRGSAQRNANRAEKFQAATGALVTLFARSYRKAEGIERSMLARGFQGEIQLLSSPSINLYDVLLLAVTTILVVGIHAAAG